MKSGLDELDYEVWKDAARQALAAFARSGTEFTAEDVRDVVGDPPGHPNAMGGSFQKASRQGLIHRVGFRPARRPSRNVSSLAVWKGGS